MPQKEECAIIKFGKLLDHLQQESPISSNMTNQQEKFFQSQQMGISAESAPDIRHDGFHFKQQKLVQVMKDCHIEQRLIFCHEQKKKIKKWAERTIVSDESTT